MKLLCIRTANELEVDEVISLEPEQARHLRDVLRLELGQLLWARTLANNDWRYHLSIHLLNKRELRLKVVAKESIKKPPIAIELVQGYPKGNRFDDVLRMAIEAGAHKVIPVSTQYGQLHKSAGLQKLDRWQRLACEAIEQSGNLSYTYTSELIELKQFLHQHPSSTRLLEVVAHPPYLLDDQELLSTELSKLQGFDAIRIFIGSEGGFSEEEIDLFRRRMAVFYRFGSTILRTEHAGLYAIAAVQALLQYKGVRG